MKYTDTPWVYGMQFYKSNYISLPVMEALCFLYEPAKFISSDRENQWYKGNSFRDLSVRNFQKEPISCLNVPKYV